MSDTTVVDHSKSVTDRSNSTKSRVCREDGCGTHLSLYNPGKYCSLHEPMQVPRTRGRKIA